MTENYLELNAKILILENQMHIEKGTFFSMYTMIFFKIMNPGSKVKTKPEKQLECKVRLAMMEWQID